MELDRSFMQQAASLIKEILPFTTYAAFLKQNTTPLFVDTENSIVYDELLGVPTSKESLLYDLLPIAESPDDLAFQLSEKPLLAYFKAASLQDLCEQASPLFFQVLCGEYADNCVSDWQQLFRSQKSNYELLKLLHDQEQNFFAYRALSSFFKHSRSLSRDEIETLLSNCTSRTALELVFGTGLQEIYNTISVLCLQIPLFQAAIVEKIEKNEIYIFQNNDTFRISFQDFKYLNSLRLSSGDLAVLKALYQFQITYSENGCAVFRCFGQMQNCEILREKVLFVQGNRLFKFVSVMNGKLCSNVQTPADFCDLVVLVLFGRDMKELAELADLLTFKYPEELTPLMSKIANLKIDEFFAETPIFRNYADQLLQFYQRLNRHRQGECIEKMYSLEFTRIPAQGVEIRETKIQDDQIQNLEATGKIIQDFQTRVSSRYVCGGNMCDRTLESSIRDLQDQMEDLNERMTVEEMFCNIIEFEE